MKITRRRKTNKRGSRKTHKRGTRKGLRSKLRGVGGSPHKGVGLGLGTGSRTRNVLQASDEGDEEPPFEYPADSVFKREIETLKLKQSRNMSKKLYSELIQIIREIFKMSKNSDEVPTQAITGTPAQLKAQITELHEKAQDAIYKPKSFFSKSSQAKSFEELKAMEAELYEELYAKL